MNKTGIIAIVLIVLAAVLAVASWVLLPETVIRQVGLDGQPTATMSKPIAVFLSFALTVLGAVMQLVSQDNKKYTVIALVGIAAFAAELAINL